LRTDAGTAFLMNDIEVLRIWGCFGEGNMAGK